MDPTRTTPDERFSRFALIGWWNQARLARAKVVVAGAGALGNEILKNLALLGIGRMVVVDLDRIEISNLSRSVLFREKDRGQGKAETAARAVREIHPAARILGIQGDIAHGIGLGLFRWADLIIGAVDNREARLAISRCCNLVGRPWIDGGIEVLSGLVRVFVPGEGSCYECTLSEVDWKLLNARRACSLLPRPDDDTPRVPTTPTTASVVAAIQCAEAVKLLHGIEGLRDEGFHFDGQGYECHRIRYQRDPECFGHEILPPVEEMPWSSSTTTAGQVVEFFRRALGPDAQVEACRELVAGLHCGACGTERRRLGALGSFSEEEAACDRCGRQTSPLLHHRLDLPPCDQGMTLREIGLPEWDIVRGRTASKELAVELSGGRKAVLSEEGGPD
jgi:molybdopterin/thiamine biosynthesis adenylyltransferase